MPAEASKLAPRAYVGPVPEQLEVCASLSRLPLYLVLLADWCQFARQSLPPSWRRSEIVPWEELLQRPQQPLLQGPFLSFFSFLEVRHW